MSAGAKVIAGEVLPWFHRSGARRLLASQNLIDGGVPSPAAARLQRCARRVGWASNKGLGQPHKPGRPWDAVFGTKHLTSRSSVAPDGVGLGTAPPAPTGSAFSGEWAFRASVLGCDGALSGHLFLSPEGKAAYLADGVQLVGRGFGHWVADVTGRHAAVELEVYQYAAAAAEIPERPHRFRGVWGPSAGGIRGDWYFCPEGERPRQVGSFQAAAHATALPLASGASVAPAGPALDTLMAELDGRRSRRPSSSRLDPYTLPGVRSVQYVRDWIGREHEQEFLRLTDMDMGAWEPMSTRSSQEWGAGDRSPCGRGLLRASLPPWQQRLADELHQLGVFDSALYPMNSVRINGYTPGQGIHPHCDGPVYYPRVAILSLGSPCVFSFYPRTGTEDTLAWDKSNDVPGGHRHGDSPQLSLLLEPRSLLVFSEDAFWHHRHGIAAVASETLDASVANLGATGYGPGQELVRTRRVSLTMRHLLPRCSWPCCSCAA